MSWYSIIHGPEIWLAWVGTCFVGIVGVIAVCIIKVGQLQARERKKRRGGEKA